LLLAFTPAASPVFGNLTMTGTNLVITGSGGPIAGNYCLLASTNLALPASQWTPIATNSFDDSGNFIFTNVLDPNSGQQFYRLQLQ
jgi:hypothetical protein